jgi:hypothetical protein
MRPELGPTEPISQAYADVLLNGLYAAPKMAVPKTDQPARPNGPAQPES